LSEDFSLSENELLRIGSGHTRSGCGKMCRLLGCNNECKFYPVRLEFLVKQACLR
jgi:hypothetical protein